MTYSSVVMTRQMINGSNATVRGKWLSPDMLDVTVSLLA